MSERNLIDNQRTSSSGSTLPSDKTQQSPTSPNSGDTQNPSPPSTSPSPSPSPSPSTPPADDNKQYLYIAVDGLTLRNADAPSPKSITPSLHLTHAPTSARASCIASIRIDTTQTSSPSLTPTSTLADVRSHLSTHYPSDHISNITSTSTSTSSPSLTSSYHFLIRGVPCTSRQENILTIQHVMPVLWIRFRDETSPATTSGVTTSPPLVTPPTNNTSTLMAPASTVAALTGDVHATNTALQQMRPTGSRIDTQQLLLSEANTRIDSLPSPPPPPPHERTTLLPRRSSMDHTGGEWKIPPSHTHDTPSSYASMGHTPRPATRDTTASKVRYHFDDNDDDDIDGEDNKHIHDVQRTQSLPISRGSPLRLSNDSRRKQHSSRSTSMLQREKSILAPVGHDLEMEGHDDPDHMSLVEDDIQKPIQIVLIGQIDVEDRARQEKRRAMIQQAREEEHLPPLTPRDTESIILKGMIVTYHDTSILLNKSRETWMNETAVDPVWIAVEEATDAQIAAIGEHFGLHPLTIEDCQSRSIREKLEVFPTYLFLVFHALDAVKEKKAEYEVMRTTPIRIIAFPNLVVSFHKSDLTAISAVRKRAAKLYHNLIDNTAWVIHGILDCITDSLLPVVKSNCDEVNSIDAIIYETEGFSAEQQKELLKRMSIAGRRLGFLRQRLWSKRDILVSLIEKDWQVFLRGVQVPYLRDVYDHLVIMLHELDAGMELLEAIQNTYLAIVSIDVATASQRTNENVKSLTAAATILLPLSLVAGVMGMNVTVPWQTGEPTPGVEDLAPFITICGGMVVVAVVMYIYFKKSKYI